MLPLENPDCLQKWNEFNFDINIITIIKDTYSKVKKKWHNQV